MSPDSSWIEPIGEILQRLRSADVPAYVVGGAVRDALLGRPVRDFDVLVTTPLDRAWLALPEAVRIEAR